MNKVISNGKEISLMTLGTVQLGMNYGIANEGGQPDETQSHEMLRAALSGGVSALDTARAYGNSEEVIGRFLKTWEGAMPYIATKVPMLPDTTSDIEVEKHVIGKIEESLTRLGVNKVDTVMLHSNTDIIKHGARAARALSQAKKQGLCDNIGVSVYYKEEIEEMIKYPELSVTQVPMSIFDQCLISSGTVKKLKERDYTVFVRSVFLQGVFFLEPDEMTDPILINEAAPYIRRLREIAGAEGMTVTELAIAFMRDTAGVTSLVLGADTPAQVKENMSYFDTAPLSESTLRNIETTFKDVNIPEIMKVLRRPKKQ